MTRLSAVHSKFKSLTITAAAIAAVIGLPAAAGAASTPVPVGPQLLIDSIAAGSNETDGSSYVAQGGDGSSVVAWELDDFSDPNFASRVFLRRISADGTLQPAVGVEDSVGGNILQTALGIAADAAGDFAVAWEDYDITSSARSSMVQVYRADGTQRTAALCINLPCGTANSVRVSGIAMDDAGDFVVLWGANQLAMQISRYSPDGSLKDAQPIPVDAGAFSVAMNRRTGDFVVASADMTTIRNFDHGSVFDSKVSFQQYDSSGNAKGSSVLVREGTCIDYLTNATGKCVGNAAAALDDAGNILISWFERDASASQLSYGFVQGYSANGVAQGSVVRVASIQNVMSNSNANPNPMFVAAADDGVFVGAWDSISSGKALAQTFSSTGALVGSRFNSSESMTSGSPAVAANANGALVVAWTGSDGHSVRAQRFAAR
jgi:hypothetical protein